MRPVALLLVFVAAGCGRSDLYRYASLGLAADAGTSSDAGVQTDAGVPDAGPLPCIPGQLLLVKATPTVMFVLDRSGSMNQRIGNRSRWQALTNGLTSALPPVDQQMEIGAYVYPAGATQNTCSLSGETTLTPRLGNVPALLSAMATRTPAGHTPTAGAIATAGTILSTYRAATAARALVLATDGAPNCNASLDVRTCACVGGGRNGCNDANMCLDDDRTVAEIRNWAKKGVPTYVIGIQDPNTGDATFVATLNAMATAGGHPRAGTGQRYYAVTSEAELDAALVTIRNQVGNCVFLTTSLPDLNGSIAVRLNGAPIAPDVGWIWGNRVNGELVLIGDACLEAAATENPVVSATIGCSDSN